MYCRGLGTWLQVVTVYPFVMFYHLDADCCRENSIFCSLAVLLWLSCPISPVLFVPLRLSRSDSPFLAVPFSFLSSPVMAWHGVTSGTGLTMMPECRCRTKQYKLTENYRCRTELFIGIPAFRHPCIHACAVHCPGPCSITKSVLRVHVHVHVHTACPCPCCMLLHSMSMLHVHVNVH